MVRNCLIAAGNSGSDALVPVVAELLDDPAAEVRGAAVWALARLDVGRFAVERERRLSGEEDESVREEWGED
jgi:epoxyqueuosine reductase